MRFTNKLNAQHIGWMFKKHWEVQGKRIPRDTGALAALEKLGIEIKDPLDVINEKVERESFEAIRLVEKELPKDETHPNWHIKPCHMYGDNNVLLEGLPQAQALTNTLVMNNLPKTITDAVNKMRIPSAIDKRIQNSIKAAHIFDAQQVKLPKVKIPDRPTQNPPRIYGISNERCSRLIIDKLLAECECLAGHETSSRRKLIPNADFKVTLTRDEDILQFTINADKLLTANRSLVALTSNIDGSVPDLHPIKPTITMSKTNIYTTDMLFPLSKDNAHGHPHTIFLHFNKENVQNLHGSAVTQSQFESRNMLKAFSVAATRALQTQGDSAKEKLDRPIVIQSVQTDGIKFHFGVFQLNTLSLNDIEGTKNYWFHEPCMNVFTECAYKDGRPILDGYNKDVIRYLYAFYSSV